MMGLEKENPCFEVRTDLALEQRESFPGDGGEVSGVSLREWHEDKSHIKLTEVKILDENGAKAMGKPQGTYLTLEADQLAKKDEDYHAEAVSYTHLLYLILLLTNQYNDIKLYLSFKGKIK